MGLADAASGQSSDNAGKAKLGLDDAIAAAVDASEPEDSSPDDGEGLKAPVKAKAKVEPEAKAEQDETAGDDDAQSEDAEAPEVDDESEEIKPLSAPKHWPEDDKKAFALMTREGQEIALKLARNLEGGFTRKSQELSDKAKFADSVRGLFDEPTRQQLRAQGLDEGQALGNLVQLWQYSRKDPVGYIKWAMQSMGVTPDKLEISQAPPQTPSTDPATATDDEIAKLLADPKVAQLEAQVKELWGIIDQEQQSKQSAQRAAYINGMNTLNGYVQSFRQSLNENGQLQYPHFDAVMAHMGALMNTDSDLAKMQDGPDKLKAAYEMAVWARPDLRQSLIEAEAQKKVVEEQKKRDAARAKKITSVKPAAGVVSSKPKTNSLDDALSSAMSKAGL